MKKAIIITVCAVLIVCVGLFFLIVGTGGTQKAIEKNLKQYFDAYYVTADIESYVECFAPEIREKAEIIQTLGTDMNMLTNNTMMAIEELGEGYTVTSTVTKVSEPTSAGLNAAKAKFSGAQMAVTVDFELTLKGGDKSIEHTGAAAYVKIDNKWYLGDTTVLTYPKEK